LRPTRRKSVVGALFVGLVVGAGGAVPSPASAVPGISTAGRVEVWGPIAASYPVTTSPAAGPWRTAVSQSLTDTLFAIKADGTLQRLAGTALEIPAAVAGQQVTAVDQYGNDAAGVALGDGSVHFWGSSRGFPKGALTVAQLGAPAAQIAVGTQVAFVLLGDGRLGMQSGFGYELVKDPATSAPLTGVVDVAGGGLGGYALLSSGRVVHIDTAAVTTVAPADAADPIIDIDRGIGVTEEGVVQTFTQVENSAVVDPDYPAELVDDPVEQVVVVGSSNFAAVRTSAGEVVVWRGEGEVEEAYQPPAAIQGKVVDLTGGSAFHAIVGEPLPPVSVTAPAAISGTPQVGKTLTGAPATFAGEPTVTNQWLANNEVIAGATGTTLTLTNDHLGDTITFRSTATRGSDEPVVSTSSPVGPVAAAPAKVASSTAVAVSPASAGYGTARTVTVTVTKAGGTPTGSVSVKVGAATLSGTLSAGKATVAVPATQPVGTHAVTASYAGDETTNASTGTAQVVVAKAASSTKVTKVKVVKAGKKVQVQLKVTTPAGVSPAGPVKIVVKKGSKKVVSKTVTVNAAGVAKLTAKKLAKGKYSVAAAYAGSATVAPSAGKKSFKV
jgi:hypothetical protein